MWSDDSVSSDGRSLRGNVGENRSNPTPVGQPAALGENRANPALARQLEAIGSQIWSDEDDDGGRACEQVDGAASSPTSSFVPPLRGAVSAPTRCSKLIAAAAHARSCKTKAGSADKPRLEPRLPQTQAQALQSILLGKESSTTREFSRNTGVDRLWLMRARCASASKCLQVELEAFIALMERVEEVVVANLVEPGNFLLGRMYDESPYHMRTDTLTEEGRIEGEASIAIVMGAKIQFAFTLFPASDNSGETAAPLVIRGRLLSRLSAVTSMHASKVLASIQATMCLPDRARVIVERIFPRTGVVVNADLHPSNAAAERMESSLKRGWPSALWRCSFHRTRTSESRTLMLDGRAESFLFNVGLTFFGTPGAWKAFNARLTTWADRKLKVYHGSPPERVLAWRRLVRPLLFPEPEGAEERTEFDLAREYCFDCLLNGDGTVSGEVQHWCSGPECCTSEAETRQKLRGQRGIRAITAAFRRFPRKSWKGQRAAAARILHLEVCHHALSCNYAATAALAEKKAANAVQRMVAVAAKAEANSCRPLDAPPGRGAADDNEQAHRANLAAAQDMEERCGDVDAFLARSDAVPRIEQACRVLDCFVIVKRALHDRSGESWRRRRNRRRMQENVVVDGPPAPDAHGAGDACDDAGSKHLSSSVGREAPSEMVAAKAGAHPSRGHAHENRDNDRRDSSEGAEFEEEVVARARPSSELAFLVVEAYLGAERRQALVAISRSFAENTGVKPLLAWRQWSRAGGLVRMLLCQECEIYPWKWTALAGVPGLALEVLDDYKRSRNIMDAVSAQHVAAYPSAAALRSARSTAEVSAAAAIAEETTVWIERGWAQVRRGQKARRQGHADHIIRSSASRTLREIEFRRWPWEAKFTLPTGSSNPPGGTNPKKRKHETPVGGGKPRNPQRKRKNSCHAAHAWMAANHTGGPFTQEIWGKYRQAMDSEAERSLYSRVGMLMRRGRPTRYQRRRQAGVAWSTPAHIKCELRKKREAAKRAKARWDPAAARQEALAAHARQWEQQWAAKRRGHRLARSHTRGRADAARSALSEYGRRERAMMTSLFPKQEEALSREPDVGQGVQMWSWSPPVAVDAWHRLCRGDRGKGLSGDDVLQWQRSHVTIDGGPRVAKMTAAERVKVISRAAGFDMSTRTKASASKAAEEPGEGGSFLPQLIAGMGPALLKFIGLPKGQKISSCPRARDVDDGWLIIRALTGSEAIGWYHVASCLWAPRFQPSFLRLRSSGTQADGGDASLEPMADPATPGEMHFWWTDLPTMCNLLCMESPRAQSISIEPWKIIGRPEGGVRVRARRWPGAGSNIAWHEEMPMPEADSQTDGEGSENGEGCREDSGTEASTVSSITRGSDAGGERGGSKLGAEASDIDEEESLHCEIAAIAQRRPKGRHFVIRNRRTGFLYEMLLTYRKPRATAPHGAYQATCCHHDPVETIGRNDKTNRLACTRELLCRGEGDDAAIVATLSKWVCAADEFSDRRGHMRTRRSTSRGDADDSDDCSSISTGQIPSDVSVSIDSSEEPSRKEFLAPRPLICPVTPPKSLCARDRRDGMGTPCA